MCSIHQALKSAKPSTPPMPPADQPRALMLQAAAQRQQRGGKADAERHFRQFQAHRACR